jgi:hypothetical protein
MVMLDRGALIQFFVLLRPLAIITSQTQPNNLNLTNPTAAAMDDPEKPTISTSDSPVQVDTEKGAAATALVSTSNPELDRRLNRKFDLHILPWIFGIWLVNKPISTYN